MSESESQRSTRVVVAGDAKGPIMALNEPLSFWGGLDPDTGLIIDHHHPQVGQSVSGSILVMPAGRGSSSASSVLAEAIRLRTAPAAIVLREVDEIIVIGSVVADELYGIATPIVVADEATFAILTTAQSAQISANGQIQITS